MRRNTTTLFLESPNATTPVAWINNAPDFSTFTEPTLSVLQKAWQDFLDSGEELEIIPDPEPLPELPVANWDNFNAQMLSDSRFIQVSTSAFQTHPMVSASVPTALLQVSTHGVNSFSQIWNLFCQIGGATSEDRITWANLGINNNLPNDFIAVLRG
jgi:hypothetical protein